MKPMLSLLCEHVEIIASVTCQTSSMPQGVMWLPGKVTSNVPTVSGCKCLKRVTGQALIQVKVVPRWSLVLGCGMHLWPVGTLNMWWMDSFMVVMLMADML